MAPYIYTPTAADIGDVTVSELATEGPNSGNPGGGSRYNTRTFRVNGTPPPTFTIAPCPTGNVQITLTDTNNYDSYTAQVGSTSVTLIRNVPDTVAITGGATTVVVTGHYAALGSCTGSATQTITLPAPAAAALFPTLTLQAPGGAATLAIGGLLAGYKYSLQFQAPGGGPFVDVPSVSITPGTTSPLTLPNAAAGRYRIFSDDACGTSPLSSDVIGTLSLTVTSANNRNRLLLTDAGGPGTTYSVTRNNVPLTTFTVIPGGLEDADVQCSSTYKYIVTATQPGGRGQAISNEFRIATVSTLLPPQPRLIASFNPNDVVELTPLPVTTPLPSGSSLRYSRSAGSPPAIDLGTRTSLRILPDSTAKLADLLANPPCYSVSLLVCGNTSPASPSTCPALLTVRAADPDGNTATISWTSFVGPDPSQPVRYVLQSLDEAGNVIRPISVTGNSYTDLTPDPRQVLRYRLQISGAGIPAGSFSYSNRASLTRQLTLTIPSAFTPNGDGLNDVLEIKGKYLSGYIFVVVDRNGQEVFRGTQRSETWDGTIKGHLPVLGAYVWRFQQNNEDGTPFSAVGSVTILK